MTQGNLSLETFCIRQFNQLKATQVHHGDTETIKTNNKLSIAIQMQLVERGAGTSNANRFIRAIASDLLNNKIAYNKIKLVFSIIGKRIH